MKLRLLYLIIALNTLVVILTVLLQCQRNQDQPEPEVITTTDTIRITDTIRQNRTVYKPVPYQVIDTFKVPANVDTSVIIAEYIKTRKYVLPVSDDSNSRINVHATVQFNRIAEWTYDAQFYPRTTVIERNHVIIEPKRVQWFAGAKFGYRIGENIGDFKLCGAINTQNDMLYSIAYDPFNRVPEVGVLWKIFK